MGQYRYSRISKPTIGVASVAFTLATLSRLGGAVVEACGLFGPSAWVASALWRSVILLGDRPVATYLLEGSRLLQHLLLARGSLWPLLSTIVNLAN
jgi:hypothetical protein